MVVDSSWRCVLAAIGTLAGLELARRMLPAGPVTLACLGIVTYVLFFALMTLSSSGRATLHDGFDFVWSKISFRRVGER